MISNKPVISYYKSGDPTLDLRWVSLLTDINVILTKRITDEFIDVCIQNKHRIFLHVNITGMGKTQLEPNIPSVKETFNQLAKLLQQGFPQKQILVIVNPVLSNDNGLRALELLLRVFTEYKLLRLRVVRLQLIQYRFADDKQQEYSNAKLKYVIANDNILKRQTTKGIMRFLTKTESFIKEYYNLIRKYESIISVDKGDEALIGVRELMPFGFNNSWTEPDGKKIKLIEYDKNSRFKPIVNIISNKHPVRCKNRCLLCPHRY